MLKDGQSQVYIVLYVRYFSSLIPRNRNRLLLAYSGRNRWGHFGRLAMLNTLVKYSRILIWAPLAGLFVLLTYIFPQYKKPEDQNLKM